MNEERLLEIFKELVNDLLEKDKDKIECTVATEAINENGEYVPVDVNISFEFEIVPK